MKGVVLGTVTERETSKEEARRLLNPVPPEKAFYFYIEVDQPLGKSSKSLVEFAEALSKIDASSVKFHLERGDFENWFKMLGDTVLKNQIAALRGKDNSSTELKGKMSSGVRSRVNQLQKIASSKQSKPQSVPSKRNR